MASSEPIYLGSVLGIDLELQDMPDGPALVKHPCVSRDSLWHRPGRADEGFASVEQSVFWEVRTWHDKGAPLKPPIPRFWRAATAIYVILTGVLVSCSGSSWPWACGPWKRSSFSGCRWAC
jgi:hypothetical protein